jgi:tartrate dehydratase alpha subunit/fumarate hydratase class I-like protein
MEKRISGLYPDIKDCYIIDDTGKIRNTNTGNYIKTNKNHNGYMRVSLMKKGGGTTSIQYHRLLMMLFKPTKNMEKLQINHIDGNKENNTLDNL